MKHGDPVSLRITLLSITEEFDTAHEIWEKPRMKIGRCPLCWVASGGSVTPFEHLFPNLRREEQILAWDQDCAAVIDVAPIGNGHCLIVTREHRPSMADALPSELASVRRLMQKMGHRISRKWLRDYVFFEHGQRLGLDQPYGCSIVHAHIHAVATSYDVGHRLGSIGDIEFIPHIGGVATLPRAVGSSTYLYVEDRRANTWLATPETTVSQVLRRQFIDPELASRGIQWNWSDQILLADAMATRERVMENLAGHSL